MTETYIDGVVLEVQPDDIKWSKKLNAGTTFSFPYPNQGGAARAVLPERDKRVDVYLDGCSAPVLSGFVMTVSSEDRATVSCADAMSLLDTQSVSPEEVDAYSGYDAAMAIGQLILGMSDSHFVVDEFVVGTDPFIPLPRGFLEKRKPLREVVNSIVKHINDETVKRGIEDFKYFHGFVGGKFRFELLPEDSDPHYSFSKGIDLYEEKPDFHFDRLVNRARATGKPPEQTEEDTAEAEEQEEAVEGPEYRDEQSIAIFGVRDPESALEIETVNPAELYIRARKEVVEKSVLRVTRKIEMPHQPFVTPGLSVVEVAESKYGAEGSSRVIQVEGSTGSGSSINVTLDTVPLDDLEVLRKVVLS